MKHENENTRPGTSPVPESAGRRSYLVTFTYSHTVEVIARDAEQAEELAFAEIENTLPEYAGAEVEERGES